MNPDDLAFLNRQLASLLQDGVSLEGALRQAATELRGPLRTELNALEADLARGESLTDAIGRRRLPALYVRLVRAGAAGGNLGGALAAAADHFEESARLRRRIQTALFYPLLVAGVGIGVCMIALQVNRWTVQVLGEMGAVPPSAGTWSVLTGLVLLGLLAIPVAMAIGPARRRLECLLPGFRDARLAQVAATFELLLGSGCPLPEAIRLVRELERGTGAAADLGRWETRLASGSGRLAEVAASGRFIPPYFRWLTLSAGDRIAEGFGRAARHYRDRARHRIDLFVEGLMPIAIVGIGFLVVMNFMPLFAGMLSLFRHLGAE